jgi:hypothetical protein
MAISVYIPTKTITDDRILPTTSLSSSLLGTVINVNGSPGEIRPATFVLKPTSNVTGLTMTVSNLIGSGNTIPSSAIDIRVVKCWYQDEGRYKNYPYNCGGSDVYYPSGKKVLLPELLLHDNTVIQVDLTTQKNFVKTTDGALHDVNGTDDSLDNPNWEAWQVKDAATLQPISISANFNQQFWITIKVPTASIQGNYTGTITLSTGEVITLNLIVNAISLSKPNKEYSLYYLSSLSSSGGLFPNRTAAQITAELKNMFEHGVTNPNCYEGLGNLSQILQLRKNVGMGGTPFYYLGLTWGNPNISQVQQVITLARSFGYTDIYFHGLDEVHGSTLANEKSAADAVRAAGGKMFAACSAGQYQSGPDYTYGYNVLDVAVIGWFPVPNSMFPDLPDSRAQWHSSGKKVFAYGMPQVGIEYPETYRRNYGLLLYQKSYDGMMDWAYMAPNASAGGNGYNDFDMPEAYKDEMFVYPTTDGVIDTIQWEGFHEAVTDIQYLTTLLNVMATTTKDKTAAQAFINSIAGLDLTPNSTVNLDSIRAQMITYIQNLSGGTSVMVTFTGNVKGSDNKNLTGKLVTITVTLPDSTTVVVTATTGTDGNYTTTYNATAPGSYSAKAVTAEDATYFAGASANVPFTVGKYSVTVTLNVG